MANVPKHVFESMRDDALVLATMAATRGPITPSIIKGLESWFGDVEVKYPIAEMAFGVDERDALLADVAEELANAFAEMVSKASEGDVEDDAFAALAVTVDPLWREITGLLAPELNRRFENTRVPSEHLQEVAEIIKYQISDNDDVNDPSVAERLKNDVTLRTHLRRIGLDPDSLV
jgi:hypothetical protein